MIGLTDDEVVDDLRGDGLDGGVAGELLRGQCRLVRCEVLTQVVEPGLSPPLGAVDDAVLLDGVEQRRLVGVDDAGGLVVLEAGLLGAGLGHVLVRTNGLCLLVLGACHEVLQL